MRKELFEFRHIVKHIGGHAALRDVSLRLYQDEITFLVGRGSGRSVLSQMMMGELTPDSGTMLLLEKPYQPLSVWGLNSAMNGVSSALLRIQS